MTFGDIIRSAAGPASGVYEQGIGGDDDTIWCCNANTDKIYELSTTDFSTVRSANSPSTRPVGIGGQGGAFAAIWHSNYWSTGTVYKLEPGDFSVNRSAGKAFPAGIGGNFFVIWLHRVSSHVHEQCSLTDFSVIKDLNPAPLCVGFGGTLETIWANSNATDIVKELSPTDFATLRSESSPTPNPRDIGGSNNTIWYSDDNDWVYELDAANIFTLSGTISDEWRNKIRDANITISNGTIYTTTTDESGAYTKDINPDTYNITVSKPLSRFHDTTESSVSISADTTKNIIMPTDKIPGKKFTSGISIVGGISLGMK